MGLVYPAFMSRAEVVRAVAAEEQVGRRWPRDPDGAPHYPGSDRDIPRDEAEARIAAGALYALRLDMAKAMSRVGVLSWREVGEGPEVMVAADPAAWGDVVLAGRETPTSYHLSVVIDDALQGVTHVVRGRDLYAATAVHRLLQVLLESPEPAYRHHRLVRDATGRKLAKSAKDTGLAELRAAGVTAAEVRTMAGVDVDLPVRNA
jgi:glutamyl-Q tRNA(Asp) synthetase